MTSSTIIALLLSLAPHTTDTWSPEGRRAKIGDVAGAIFDVTHGQPRRVAMLVALGQHETHFAQYVLEGRCTDGPRGQRCDPDKRGVPRARGAWQLHARACPAAWALPDGSTESIRAEAACADRLLRWFYGACRQKGRHGSIVGAFSGYAGRGCSWTGGRVREATYLRLLRRVGG